MASFVISSLVAASMLLPDVAASNPMGNAPVEPTARITSVRGGCGGAAAQAAAMTGGEVLSVEAAGGGRPVCRVTVLVINAKGRPKKIRLKIPMDQ